MTTTATLTAEEKKILMKAIWGALQTPEWTKDNLIDFGKAIHSKKSLKELDDKAFEKIFPFLEKVTISLGDKLHTAATVALAKPDETPAATPEKDAAEEETAVAGALENV